MPPVAYSEEEPRYVNAAQFKRMMIMRIKRAARDLKMNRAAETARPPTNAEGSDSISKVTSKTLFSNQTNDQCFIVFKSQQNI